MEESQALITITLAAKYHYLIIGCLNDKNSAARFKYVKDIANAMSTTYDPEQIITVDVKAAMVKEIYLLMGQQQERFVAVVNAEMKELLMSQLVDSNGVPKSMWLIGELQNIAIENSAWFDNQSQAGYNFLMAIK